MNRRIRKILAWVGMGLLIPGCFHAVTEFDETKWMDDIQQTDTSLLYAPHFRDGRFYNPWMPSRHGGLGRFLQWKFGPGEIYTREEKEAMPGVRTDLAQRIREWEKNAEGKDFLAWVGHSTYLFRINGQWWLTDPMFSERALLPKRKTPPGITADELTRISGRWNILITHNHYDHLDTDSLRALPSDARIFVPLGLKSLVESLGKTDVREMDWWDSADVENGTSLVCLPAQHWSRRVFQGVNTTLWVGFLLKTPEISIYISGDTGYFTGFAEFGRRFPGIDYAIMSIGAYHPRWFMHYAHMNVEEALQAFRELGAGHLIPAHWGAFQLGDEPVGYPLVDLRRKIGKAGISPSAVRILDVGELMPAEGKANSDSFENRRDPEPAAAADTLQRVAGLTATHFVKHSNEDPRPGTRDRMAQ